MNVGEWLLGVRLLLGRDVHALVRCGVPDSVSVMFEEGGGGRDHDSAGTC